LEHLRLLKNSNNISKKAIMFMRKASPVKEIMNFADPEYIRKLGVNPNNLISFAGGWVNHNAPENLRKAYVDITSDPKQFHSSGAYSPTLGDQEFKTALCKFEHELYGMNISETQIAVGSSSTQLAMELFTVLLDPHDKILLLDPSYCNFPTQLITEIPEIEILRFSVIDEENWKFIADEKIEEFSQYILENKPKIVMLVSPDNPTSKVLSHEFVQATFNAVKKINGFLIIDFAYKELTFDDNLPEYFSWPPNENFISLHSNSKWCRGLGRRIGWIESPKFVIESMESIQNSTILGPDKLHQMAMTKFINNSLDDGSLVTYVKETKKLYKTGAKRITEFLRNNLDYPILEPEGGLYVFMNVGKNSAKFVEEILKKTDVLFIPGWGFGRSGNNAVRISFGPLINEIDKIEEGILKVAKYINKN
jgi:aspartate/methionine/tyrosine aminotransferase